MINIYACGGCGINIVSQLPNLQNATRVFIDSSESNLKNKSLKKKEDVFLIEDMDGAGKLRMNTYEQGRSYVDDILIKHKPSEVLNIVVGSLSGGTGSVIAPLIVKALTEQNKNVIAIGVITKNSVVEIRNSANTIKSYKGIVDKIGSSIALVALDEPTRTKADDDVHTIINILALLANKEEVSEFDITDLHNFIRFEKVTDNEPDLALVQFNSATSITDDMITGHVVSTILLTEDINYQLPSPKPEYQGTAIVNKKGELSEPIRIDSIMGEVPSLIESLESDIKAFEESKKLKRTKTVEVNGNADGLVI